MAVRFGAVQGNGLAGVAGRRDHVRCHPQLLRGGKLLPCALELFDEMRSQDSPADVITCEATTSACEKASCGSAPWSCSRQAVAVRPGCAPYNCCKRCACNVLPAGVITHCAKLLARVAGRRDHV